MFGYVIVNKQEMKFREFDFYKSYYCGFCQELRNRYGRSGQMTLSYDMTFVIILLTSLYEIPTETGGCKCVAHPFERHPTRRNEFTEYAADMNLLLSYYKCMDDWQDERKLSKRVMAASLKRKFKNAAMRHPQKAKVMEEKMERIHQCEKQNSENIDEVSGYFGEIMSEIFAWRKDEWETDLRKMGFFLGKFIYLMDAFEDIEKDRKTGNYNPFRKEAQAKGFEDKAGSILTMMMAECSKAFERLPIIENTQILRNILYSGVWCRYEIVRSKREHTQEVENTKDTSAK